MANFDYFIFILHSVFWLSFVLTRLLLRSGEKDKGGGQTAAPYSRALVAFHGTAFALMYIGLNIALLSNRVPAWFSGQRLVGSLIMLAGAVLSTSALLHFRSWRFRAAVDKNHQLATGGPFRLLRHPIYMGLNLLALGSAVWVPTPMVWTAFALMAIGGDLRARAEETLLTQVFGSAYQEYSRRTRRFLPGIY